MNWLRGKQWIYSASSKIWGGMDCFLWRALAIVLVCLVLFALRPVPWLEDIQSFWSEKSIFLIPRSQDSLQVEEIKKEFLQETQPALVKKQPPPINQKPKVSKKYTFITQIAKAQESDLLNSFRSQWFQFQGSFDPKNIFGKHACRSLPTNYYCYEMLVSIKHLQWFLNLGMPAFLNEKTTQEGILISIEDAGVLIQTHDDYLPLQSRPHFESIRLVFAVPFGFARVAKLGDSGAYIGWLDAALLAWEQKKSYPKVRHPKRVYDPALETRLKAFQKAKGLTPDGVLGIGTYIALMQALQAFMSIDLRTTRL